MTTGRCAWCDREGDGQEVRVRPGETISAAQARYARRWLIIPGRPVGSDEEVPLCVWAETGRMATEGCAAVVAAEWAVEGAGGD